jgi:hypothetical protein
MGLLFFIYLDEQDKGTLWHNVHMNLKIQNATRSKYVPLHYSWEFAFNTKEDKISVQVGRLDVVPAGWNLNITPIKSSRRRITRQKSIAPTKLRIMFLFFKY